MILDFLLLADAAHVSNGKVFIHGGGFTRLNLPVIPFRVPQVTAVARFVLEESDTAPFKIAAEWRRVGGNAISPRIESEIDPTEVTALEGEERSLFLVVSVGGLLFDAEGKHELLLILDGEPVASREMLVVQSDEAVS